MLQKDNPPEDQVLAQSEVIGGLETKQRKQALHTLLTVRSLLTHEQRVSLREAMRPHGPLKHDQER